MTAEIAIVGGGLSGLALALRLERQGRDYVLIDARGRVFGQRASAPLAVHIKDWARDPFTATNADQAPLYEHPRYHPLRGLWDDRILFSGTEVAPQFGGFLEGALEAAENTPI